ASSHFAAQVRSRRLSPADPPLHHLLFSRTTPRLPRRWHSDWHNPLVSSSARIKFCRPHRLPCCHSHNDSIHRDRSLLDSGRFDRRRSEEHTSELQSHLNLVCRLLLEKKNVVKIVQ